MKRFLKGFLILVIIAALGAGGIYLYKRQADKKPVKVQRIESLLLSWSPTSSSLYGTVTAEENLTILQDKDRILSSILVEEGQEIHIGDPIAKYDATKDQLTLAEKRLDREKVLKELQEQYKKYKKYARQEYERTVKDTPIPTFRTPTPKLYAGGIGYEPVRLMSRFAPYTMRLAAPEGGKENPIQIRPGASAVIPSRTVEKLKRLAKETLSTPEPHPVYGKLEWNTSAMFNYIEIYATPEGKSSFTVNADEKDRPNRDKVNFSTLLYEGADGSAQRPYTYLYASDIPVPETFLDYYQIEALSKGVVYVRLEAKTFTVDLRFVSRGEYSVTVNGTPETPAPTPTHTPTPEPSEEPEPSEDPDFPGGGGGGGGGQDRQTLMYDYAQKIRDNELKYRQLELDIIKLESQGADGIAYSTIEGTVTKVNKDAANGETVLEIRGGSGVNVIAVISETDLDRYPVGMQLDGFAYDSSRDVRAEIASISTMPVTESYSNGGNPNSSGYLASLKLLNSVSLKIGEYIEFTSESRNPVENGEIYLYEAFIREINGKDYIFVDRDGILTQTRVFTGRKVYNYVELIGSDLTADDYIAFPYEKTVRDGAPTEKTEESFW